MFPGASLPCRTFRAAERPAAARPKNLARLVGKGFTPDLKPGHAAKQATTQGQGHLGLIDLKSNQVRQHACEEQLATRSPSMVPTDVPRHVFGASS